MANLISQVTPHVSSGTATDYGLRASAIQYGTCSTAMTATVKTVSCSSFTSNYLTEGSVVAVKFTAANSSDPNNEADPANLKLNVNSTGEKPIKYIYNGALSNLPSKGFLKQNRVYLFYYDGANWVAMIANDTDTKPVDTSVTGGSAELDWGETTTIATINGVDIAVTMPENPDTTYTFTETGSGNAITSMTVSDTTVTFDKGATYNNYSHPSYTSHESGLYKVTVDNTGHVSGATTVTKSDITALGIPDKNTTYTFTKSGSGNALSGFTVSGTEISFSTATYNNYSHPTYTSQESGLYKITVDNTGHVSSTSAATISDLPHNHDDAYLKLTGGTLTGTLTLSSASGTDSPALRFQRGTLSDNYNDWQLVDSGGYLYFQERGSGSSSWTNRVTMMTNGTVVATTFSGNATSATKATQDSLGNDIPDTYATKEELTAGLATKSSSTHTHGNISNTGTMTATASIANGDRLVITDSSDSHKIVGSSISFDGTTATKALTQKGTWETFNNYSHPSYTSHESGMYKITVNEGGHVSGATAITKSDITALGIPSENTVYTFTTSGNGNAVTGLSVSGSTITFNKDATYNNYSHPTYTSQETGLYKFSVNGTGHVDSTTAITKSDITALGIPEKDTTYTFTKSGTGNALTGFSVSGTTITFSSANYNNYSHPTYTSQESGLYKITVDTTGHVSSATTVSKADITGLGIPSENTTYTITTTGDGNAVTAVGLSGTTITVTKGASYNNYSHPTYTSQESGLYKVTVDGTGHVSSTTTVSKADITGLGIPSENTTYSFTTTGTGNAVTAVTLSGTTVTVNKGATYNNYSHPTYTSQELGFYKIGVDGTGHVSSTSAITDGDIKTT